jgi:hypothetical protein
LGWLREAPGREREAGQAARARHLHLHRNDRARGASRPTTRWSSAGTRTAA